MVKQNREFVPPLIFDKVWRSGYATDKFVKNILLGEFNFRHKTVLDFGCGTGSYCVFFDADKYLGLDINEPRIKYAKKQHSDYDFLCSETGELADINKTFDFVFVVSVLHHLADKDCVRYIQQFYKILKQGGRIIAMEPCLFVKSWFNNRFMKFMDRGNYIRTAEEYKNLFPKELFNITVHKKYKRHFLYNEIFFSAEKNVS